MSDEQADDALLQAAFRRWQASRPPSAERPELSVDELSALVEGTGDDPERIAALDAALASPTTAADLSLLLAAQAAARAAVHEGTVDSRPPLTELSTGPMMNDRSKPRAAPIWRRVLPLAASLIMVASVGTLVWQGRERDVTRGDSALPPVVLVGERVGVLVWRPVPDATSYSVEVLDKDGVLLFSATAADTVAPLPPGFDAPQWSSWWVRAFTGRREVAASPMTAFY